MEWLFIDVTYFTLFRLKSLEQIGFEAAANETSSTASSRREKKWTMPDRSASNEAICDTIILKKSIKKQ